MNHQPMDLGTALFYGYLFLQLVGAPLFLIVAHFLIGETPEHEHHI